MTARDALDKLNRSPELCDALLCAGVLVPSKLTQYQALVYYERRLATLRKKRKRGWKGRAMEDTIKKFRVSKDTIYRIKQTLK